MDQRLRSKNVPRECLDAIIIKTDGFDLIFVIHFWKSDKEVVANIDILELGVVCEFDTSQLIVVQIDLADTRHDISLKLMYIVVGKVEFLEGTQVHQTKFLESILTQEQFSQFLHTDVLKIGNSVILQRKYL